MANVSMMKLSRGLAAAILLAACTSDDGGADGTGTGTGDDSGTGMTTAPSTMTAPSTTMTTMPGTDDGTGSGEDTGSGTAVVDDTGSGTADESGSGSETGTAACGVTPGKWAAPDWDDNTVDALALRAALDTLTGNDGMRGAETGTVVIDELADLTGPWEAGTPSLAEVATPAFAAVVTDSFQEFFEVVEAGEQDLVDAGGMWTPGASGGIWGDTDRGINEGGLEIRQIVDKGGFSGGALFNYAASLTEFEVTEATIDAIAALWGANAALDPLGDLTDSANYSYQMGFHGQIADALAAAKAFAADDACTAERDEALVTAFNLWEQSMHARLVFYANEMVLALTSATTDTEFANALHELAEGVGLVAGFHGYVAPSGGPLSGGLVTTDADIELMMSALGVVLDDLGTSTTGNFVEDLPAAEAAVTEMEGVIMDVYGLDAADIMAYRMPTPG
jgi:hypothetical protein